MIAPIPKQKPGKDAGSIIAAMESLQASAGWAILLKILNDNIAYLESAIISKIDPATRATMSDIEIEELRLKRNLNIELRDTPANYSKTVASSGVAPKNYDPYYQLGEKIV